MLASPPRSFAAAVAGDFCPPGKVEVSYGEVQGCPAVFISDDDMRALARPFSFTLFGKFAVSRPPLDVIRSFVVRMRFLGKVFVDPLDKFHVSFRFADSRDYIRFFARRSFQVFGVEMRIFKWSPFIDFHEELPVFPIWISFPGIRFQLFHASTLLDIAGAFGKALCVDSATAALGNLSCARVLVEVDISRPIPERIWLGSQESGFFQKVVFEGLPPFCHRCMACGHAEADCRQSQGGVLLSAPASAPPCRTPQGGSVDLGGFSPGPLGSSGGPIPVSLPVPLGLEGTSHVLSPLVAREDGGPCIPPDVQVVSPIAQVGLVGVLGVGVGASVPGVVARLDGGAAGGPSLTHVGLAGISREPASVPVERVECNHSMGGEGEPLLVEATPGVGDGSGLVEDGSESAESLIMEPCSERCGRILPASFRLEGGGGSAPLNFFPVGFPARGVITRSMVKAGGGLGLLHQGKGDGGGSGGSHRHKKGKKGKRKKSESRLSYESSHALASAFEALFKVPSYE